MRDHMKLSRSSRVLVCGLSGILGLALGSCSGGGGSGGEDSGGLRRPTTVTVVGRVDDGTSQSPIGYAICHFVHGTQSAEAITRRTPWGFVAMFSGQFQILAG
jgi:hypothetical protein